MVKVSVVMITYNHERFIEEAVRSVMMQQTNFDYELIIGEDCSTDNTRAIVEDLQRQYPDKIRLILQPHNVGMVPNFIQAHTAASGQYTALCEGDDYWTDPHKLQKQVDFLEAHPDYVMTYHDQVRIDEHGNVLAPTMRTDQPAGDVTSAELITWGWLYTATVCFRNVFTDYPPEFLRVYNGDTFLFSILGQHGAAKYMGNSIAPTAYRIHPGGVWSPLRRTQKKAQAINTRYWMARYYARIGQPHYAHILFTQYHRELCKLVAKTLTQRDFATARKLTDQFRTGQSWRYAPTTLVSGAVAVGTDMVKKMTRRLLRRSPAA
jgi:glycosyltransferase involved in cell wall biosynthesis